MQILDFFRYEKINEFVSLNFEISDNTCRIIDILGALYDVDDKNKLLIELSFNIHSLSNFSVYEKLLEDDANNMDEKVLKFFPKSSSKEFIKAYYKRYINALSLSLINQASFGYDENTIFEIGDLVYEEASMALDSIKQGLSKLQHIISLQNDFNRLDECQRLFVLDFTLVIFKSLKLLNKGFTRDVLKQEVSSFYLQEHS